MAPTICSGKKRQTRTIATTNIRRHGQGAHQLNQAFSNIVNFVAKGSRVPASLRIQTHNQIEENLNTTDYYHLSANIEADLIYNYLIQTSATRSAPNHRLQRYSFLSDNAVTSSTHSDTENSLDLRLANEILGIDTSSATTSNDSNITNTSSATSLSPLSSTDTTNSFSSTNKEITSSSSSVTQRQEILLNRCSSSLIKTHKLAGHSQNSSDSEEADLYDKNGINNKINLKKTTTELQHSINKRKHFFSDGALDSEDDELERVRELNSDMSGTGSDTDMETDDTDSMTSLNTEKSAKLKRGNHPLLSDKLFVKHPENSSNSNNSNSSSNSNSDNKHNNAKSKNKQSNTDGLLSIAVKTIKLVRRNQLLQQRLTQLQLETTEFIQSVLANPENRHYRENIKQKV